MDKNNQKIMEKESTGLNFHSYARDKQMATEYQGHKQHLHNQYQKALLDKIPVSYYIYIYIY